MKQAALIDWNAVRERLRTVEETLREATHPSAKTISEALDRRARSLAERKSREAAGDDACTLLVFRLGADRFALELKDVLEVGPLRCCTRVPGAPAEVVGVVSHRGEVRTVIDLARSLGRTPDDNAGKGYFVHLRTAEFGTLLRVDAIETTLGVRAADLFAPEAAVIESLGRRVKAVHRDGIVVLRADAPGVDEECKGEPEFKNA